jgi:hypothetical protein
MSAVRSALGLKRTFEGNRIGWDDRKTPATLAMGSAAGVVCPSYSVRLYCAGAISCLRLDETGSMVRILSALHWILAVAQIDQGRFTSSFGVNVPCWSFRGVPIKVNVSPLPWTLQPVSVLDLAEKEALSIFATIFFPASSTVYVP